jgi:D-proline reductase (dithiol) PrdB
MTEKHQRVDSFKFLPRLISTFYKMTEREPELPIPWAPVLKPIEQCNFGLITSGGLYHTQVDPPFDLEREKEEPTWGDPSYRKIPLDIPRDQIGASHLHINTEDVLEDVNILLPLDRFIERYEDGQVGGLARYAYSFMGYQGFPPDTQAWEEIYGPRVAEEMRGEEVDCVFLTPA